LIQAISSMTRPIVTPGINHLLSNGKSSFPVKPMYSVYAKFKHIIGIPSWDKENQVPVSKLRILDTLIDRLYKIQSKNSDILSNIVSDVKKENIEPLISQLEQKLHHATVLQKPAFTGLYPETGLVLDILA
jgi:hypothetical protein